MFGGGRTFGATFGRSYTLAIMLLATPTPRPPIKCFVNSIALC